MGSSHNCLRAAALGLSEFSFLRSFTGGLVFVECDRKLFYSLLYIGHRQEMGAYDGLARIHNSYGV